MIGKVEWDWQIDGLDDPIHVVMVLGDDCVFRSEQMPRHAESLTQRCREDYGGPSDGAYGVRFLNELAREHDGVATIEEKPGPPPGTIY
jgi:hypothetical protein